MPLLRSLSNIRVGLLVILLFFGVGLRCVYITQPYIDAWSWRQSDVAIIAENFYRYGYQLLYPQITWAGEVPGYVGTEFPLVPFTAALLYPIFGVQEWIGRVISVFFFSISLPFFYYFISRIWNKQTAFFALIIYLFTPLNFYASRSFMPDTTSLSFSIISLYLFREWLEHKRGKVLFISMCFTTSLAILVKLPAILIGLPMLYMTYQEYGMKFLLRRKLWYFAIIVLVVPLVWYIHAYRLSKAHFPYHMFGEGGLKIMGLDFYVKVFHDAVMLSLTPILFIAMLIGMVLPSRSLRGHVFHWWLLAIVAFALIAGNGHRHQWYLLPLTPVAAALAGRACDAIWSKVRMPMGRNIFIIAASICFIGFIYLSYLSIRPLYNPWAAPLLNLGKEINLITQNSALIAIADEGDPTAFYYSKRKGWHFPPSWHVQHRPKLLNGKEAIDEIEDLRQKGASHIAFTQHTRYWLDDYPDFREHLDSLYWRERETGSYTIFNLTAPAQ